jgi:hypothetical protein
VRKVCARLPGVDHNCGPAGHSFYIRNNTFFYTEDNAIKLRGTPEVGMFIGSNVFSHPLVYDGVSRVVPYAVTQTETGIVDEGGNRPGATSAQVTVCDFDADGLNDTFMATGAGWWYRSGGTAAWAYLNTSTKRLPELTLGYYDQDSRCDVLAGGVVHPGGMQPPADGRLPFGGRIKLYWSEAMRGTGRIDARKAGRSAGETGYWSARASRSARMRT